MWSLCANLNNTAIINWDRIKIGTGNIFYPYTVIGFESQHTYEKTYGNLLIGTFDKNFVNNKIVKTILDKYNYETLIKCIENFQFIINNFITNFSSFTIGVKDFIIDDEIKNDMNNLINKKFENLSNLININEISENDINSDLGSILNEISEYTLDELDYGNNMKMLILSGSKGKNANIGQTMISLGQQSLNGNRIPIK